MEYVAYMSVPFDFAEKMETLCNGKTVFAIYDDDIVFQEKVVFDNGLKAVVEVVYSENPEESCYCHSILISETISGRSVIPCEVSCSEAKNDFIGEYIMYFGGDRYTIHVRIE